MSDRAQLDEILQEFLVEARENLVQFELALLELEADPTQAKPLQALFRSVHSIKGSCSFFELRKIEAVTHAAENLLDRVRDGRLSLTPEITNVILVMVDVVRNLLRSVEADRTEGELDVAPLVGRLEQLIVAEGASPRVRPSPEASDAATAELGGMVQSADELRALMARDGKVRVDTHVLEKLMNLVGELVLARNQIVQHANTQQNQVITAAAQRLSFVTTEIQEVVMKTRMQPMSHVFSRFPRLVRDLARQCGKQVRLELEGRETELDRTLIEAIQDPLTHLVRNALDHGIEEARERARAGKPVEGRVFLRAYHEAGMVNIEVTDDGAGIDTEAVRRKAVAQGLVAKDVAARMSDREIWGFLFVAGFSTQEAVTHVSGRGVGMDVVKTNIEKIGGSVDVHSEPQRGTTVRIKIPLTLAIIPALIVSSAGERYAIPQASLLEVVRLEAGDEQRRIELIQGTPVLRLRGRILPLLDLSVELGQRASMCAADEVAIVILQANERSFGLVVDEINDTEEIVVKPLWKRLKGLTCYAGATVMGDGRVGLILEPLGLAQRVGVMIDVQAREDRARREQPTPQTNDRMEQLLLCRSATDGRVAIPLSKVARLEELPVRHIERMGSAEVAQYRNGILPLYRLANVLEERRKRPRHGAAAPDNPDALPVVVFADGERNIGLVVDGILDVVEADLSLSREGARRGVRGSMVLHGRVTEVLDVEELIHMAEPRPAASRSAVTP